MVQRKKKAIAALKTFNEPGVVAAWIGISKRHFDRRIKEMEDLGLFEPVTIKGRQFRTRRYTKLQAELIKEFCKGRVPGPRPRGYRRWSKPTT